MTNRRWIVVALLFFAVTVNYIDRAVLGVLKPLLDQELGWSQKDYGWMVTAFQASYALGYLLAGRFLDKVGVRLGLFVAVLVWSVAAVAHAAARSVLTFSIARSILGLAEGGCFPGAIKAVTDWFPKEQRAFATGVFATPLVSQLWLAVAFVTIAAAAHCGFAPNLFTLVSDTVPREAVSSVVGIGGMAGSVAGMFFAQLVARVLHFTDNNYLVPFALAASAYLLALGLMHLLAPRLEPMPVNPAWQNGATAKAG
jgi:MFS family permease